MRNSRQGIAGVSSWHGDYYRCGSSGIQRGSVVADMQDAHYDDGNLRHSVMEIYWRRRSSLLRHPDKRHQHHRGQSLPVNVLDGK